MALILSRVGKMPNIADHTIQFDTSDEFESYDVSTIPPGSKCMVLSPAVTYYILNGEKEWVEINQQIWEEFE